MEIYNQKSAVPSNDKLSCDNKLKPLKSIYVKGFWAILGDFKKINRHQALILSEKYLRNVSLRIRRNNKIEIINI